MKNTIRIDDVELIPMDAETPKESVWQVRWIIKERPRKNRNVLRKIGEIWFEGEPERGTLAMDFNIEPEFKQDAVVKSVIKGFTDWAFAHNDIYEITVNTPTGDYYRTDAVERAGYVYRIGNREVEHYSIVKPKTTWLGLYILIGIVAGFLMGILFGSMSIGMAMGVVIGMLMGAVLDTKANRTRAEVTGKVEDRRHVRSSDTNE